MFSARPIAGCETKPTAHSGARTLLLQCFLLIAREHEDRVESRDLIFAGLIDAIYKCATDARLKGALVVKALIPKELAHGARARSKLALPVSSVAALGALNSATEEVARS